MNKQNVLDEIIKLLICEVESLAKAARTAHKDATGAESKAENKYDTRGLEASYLAEAQSKMAKEAAYNLDCYKNIQLGEFSENSKVQLTAIVELESEELEHSFYFIGPTGGGLEALCDDVKVLLITPASPLGSLLMKREVGDYIELKTGGSKKGFEVISIC